MRVAAIAASVVAVGAVPRLLLAADALPSWLRPLVWSDVLHTWERGLSGGRLPYWDTFFEYPPLVGYTSAGLSLTTGMALAYVAAWAALQVLAAAAIAAILAAAAGPRWALVRWSLAPALLLHGTTNFELFAVLPLVVAVVLLRRGRIVGGSVALAVGTAAKLFPAVALPVALLRGPAAWPVAASAFVLVVGGLYLPGLGARYSTAESLARYSVRIGANFDSVWGLAELALRAGGLDARGGIVLVTLAGLALTYLVVVVPAARAARDPAAPVALAVATLLLWSRLFSPQYALWLLPFFALLRLSTRTYALFVAADVAVFATVYPLTLVPWGTGDAGATALFGALTAAVLVRQLAVLLAWRELRGLARSAA